MLSGNAEEGVAGLNAVGPIHGSGCGSRLRLGGLFLAWGGRRAGDGTTSGDVELLSAVNVGVLDSVRGADLFDGYAEFAGNAPKAVAALHDIGRASASGSRARGTAFDSADSS